LTTLKKKNLTDLKLLNTVYMVTDTNFTKFSVSGRQSSSVHLTAKFQAYSSPMKNVRKEYARYYVI